MVGLNGWLKVLSSHIVESVVESERRIIVG